MKDIPYVKQKALWSVPFFAAGIIIQYFFRIPLAVISIVLLFSCLYVLRTAALGKQSAVATGFILIFFFSGGAVRSEMYFRHHPSGSMLNRRDGPVGNVICTVKTRPVYKYGKWRFYAKALRYDDRKGVFRTASGGLSVRIKDDRVSAALPGDTVALQGLISCPDGARNIGDFDYRMYLFNRDVETVLEARTVELKPLKEFSVQRTLFRIRQKAADILNQSLPYNEKNRVIARTTLLGPQTDMAPDIKEDFRAAGLLHILAVSGFHTGVVISVACFLLSIICRIPLVRFGASLAVLWLYALITGLPPSVERAAWMASLLLFSVYAEKRYAPLNALSLSGLIILFLKPGMVFDAGFQLSFAATFGILLYFRNRKKLFPVLYKNRMAAKTVDLFGISIFAVLFTAPIVLHYFGQMSLWGIVAGIPAAFLAGFSILLNIIVLFTHFVSTGLSSCFGALNSVVLDGLRWTARIFNGLPGTRVVLMFPTIQFIVIYYSVLVLFLHLYHRRARKAAVFIIALIICLTGLLEIRDAPLEITLFDVGDGDAILLELPDHRNIMIDGGNCRWNPEGRYQSKILQLLRRKNIGKLDALFISHYDADHYCGFISVLDSMPVKQIFANGYVDSTRMCHRFLEAVKMHGIDYINLRAGRIIRGLPEGYALRVLHPSRDYGNKNDNSLVMMFECDGKKILFTGDAGEKAQRDLAEITGEVDILKTPHHGELDPGTMDWIRQMDPELILISNRNRKRERGLMRQRDFRTVTTSRSGMITVRMKDGEYTVRRNLKPDRFKG